MAPCVDATPMFDRVYCRCSIDCISSSDENEDVDLLQIDGVFQYFGFCDDFGPMSLGTVYRFCNMLDGKLAAHDRPVIVICDPEERSITNMLFLLGAYMIMKLDHDIEQVMPITADFENCILSYKDVSPGQQNFHLHLEDCWSGLIKAKKLEWVRFEKDGFDVDAYELLDDPLNADLHEIVPGKFIAMKGPKTLPKGQLWKDCVGEDGAFSHRDFSPAHYAEILQQYDVQTVLRLNSPEYDKQEFVDAGIAVADLFFEDCSVPPMHIIAKALLIAESVPGALAVHCQAGLGRTGTIIGLYMMRHYGFTAREAMGWLRIVRPGSVIGRQQDFLCKMETSFNRLVDLSSIDLSCDNVESLSVEAVESLTAEIIRKVDANTTAIRPSGCWREKMGKNMDKLVARRKELAAHVCAASNRRAKLCGSSL